MRVSLIIILLPGIARPAIAGCDRALPPDIHVGTEYDQLAAAVRREQLVRQSDPVDPAQADDSIQISLDHGIAGPRFPHIQDALHRQPPGRRIEIRPQVVRQPGPYGTVLEPDRKHPAADEAAFAADAALRAAAFAGSMVRDSGTVEHWVKSVIDHHAQPLHAARRAVDSPAERPRLAQVCAWDA